MAPHKQNSINQMKASKPILQICIIISLLTAAGTLRAAAAKELWDKHCASCHGKDGRGDTKMGKKAGVKDYTDPKFQEALKDDAAFKAIKEGVKDKGKEVMKPFAEKLTDEEIKALVGYLHTFKKAA